MSLLHFSKQQKKTFSQCLQEWVLYVLVCAFFGLLLHLKPETLCSLFWILPSCTHIGGYGWKGKQEDHHAHSFLMILLQHFNALALFSNGLCRRLKLRPTMGSGLCCACHSQTNESCKPNPFSHCSYFGENIKINGGQGTYMTDLWERDQQDVRPGWYLMHLNLEMFHNTASKSLQQIQITRSDIHLGF